MTTAAGAGSKERAVGIVGAGAITRSVHLPVLQCLPGAHVAWIADAADAAALEAAEGFGLRAVSLANGIASLPACDVVLLALPLHAREPYMKLFAERRTAILAEKPFARDVAEHRKYLGWLDGVPVACGYMRRTYAVVRALRRIVGAGWFGRLRAIRFAEGGRVTSGGSASLTLGRSYRDGGGVLNDLGCHGLDTIGFLTGADDLEVSRCAIEWDGANDRHVAASFIATTAEGAATEVDYTVSWLIDQPNEIEMRFDRCVVRAELQPGSRLELAGEAPSADELVVACELPGARTSYQAFYLEWEAVIEGLRRGVDPSDLSARDGLWTTSAIERLYRAGGAP